jgi:hypothetical protein
MGLLGRQGWCGVTLLAVIREPELVGRSASEAAALLAVITDSRR